MKTTQFRWLVTMLLFVTAMVMPSVAWAWTQPEGEGTEAKPYQIGNADELYWFAALVNGELGGGTQNTSANAVLTADINNNYNTWTPIGFGDSYTGTFDGQGHTISGLGGLAYSNAPYVGLFGNNSGTIKNVGVVESYFNEGMCVGGVCGYNKGGTITGCYNTGQVSGSNFVGGVCGLNENGTITGCYNTGKVSDSDYVGGVCGYNNGGTITGCYNTGTVSDSYNVGGVCGSNFKGTITSCYTNDGSVCGVDSGTVTDDCGVNTAYEFTDGTVCSLLNKALKKANASVRFYQGTEYPELIKNLPSLVGDVYQISNKEELYAFALLVNNVETSANAVLTADITVNTGVLKENGTLNNNGSGFEPWTPIGNAQNPYTGTFDGQGYTISGLYFNHDYLDVVGLFGSNSGTIKNVTIVDSYLHGQQFIGGVCGYNLNEVTNCSYTGIVQGNETETYAGGVSGCNAGKITNCYTAGAVSGKKGIGGVCGINGGSIIACYNIGTVSGTQYTYNHPR